jgi:hypothetical protein
MQVARETVEQAVGEKMDGTPYRENIEKTIDARNPRKRIWFSGREGIVVFR